MFRNITVSAQSGYCAAPTKPSWVRMFRAISTIAVQRAQVAPESRPKPVKPMITAQISVIHPQVFRSKTTIWFGVRR